jgi:hypothetical protein
MKLDYEIVSDAPVAARKRKDAKKIPREPEQGTAVVQEPNAVAQKESRENGLVEVEVVKLCPNPRLLIARYVEQGVERLIKVRVGRKRDYFRPRMRLMLERPPDWEKRLLPWDYTGKKPRLPGRW